MQAEAPFDLAILRGISHSFPWLSPSRRYVPIHYSPVRHSTHFRRSFLVRLACVKHAASVRSEPGSNSPVEKLNPSNEPKLVWIKKTQKFFPNSTRRSRSEDPNVSTCYPVFKERRSFRSGRSKHAHGAETPFGEGRMIRMRDPLSTVFWRPTRDMPQAPVLTELIDLF